MGEVAQEHAPEVSLSEGVLAECEVVHEAVEVVLWPHEVQSVDQCVQGDDKETNVTIRQLSQQFLYLPIDLIIEQPLWKCSTEE